MVIRKKKDTDCKLSSSAGRESKFFVTSEVFDWICTSKNKQLITSQKQRRVRQWGKNLLGVKENFIALMYGEGTYFNPMLKFMIICRSCADTTIQRFWITPTYTKFWVLLRLCIFILKCYSFVTSFTCRVLNISCNLIETGR